MVSLSLYLPPLCTSIFLSLPIIIQWHLMALRLVALWASGHSFVSTSHSSIGIIPSLKLHFWPSFLEGVWGFKLRFSCSLSKGFYPLNHLPRFDKCSFPFPKIFYSWSVGYAHKTSGFQESTTFLGSFQHLTDAGLHTWNY